MYCRCDEANTNKQTRIVRYLKPASVSHGRYRLYDHQLPLHANHPAGPPPVSALRNGYVANTTGQVYSYTISAAGLWDQIPGSVVPAGVDPVALTVDVTGRFAYVLNIYAAVLGGGSSISEYVIDPSSGVLQPNTGSISMQGNVRPQFLTMEPTGHFLYSDDSQTGGIAAFRVDQTSGLLTPNSPAVYPLPVFANAAITAGSFAVHPSGRFLYANTGLYILSYTLDPTSGLLTYTGYIENGSTRGFPPVIDPKGRFLYAVDEGNTTVNRLAIDPLTGILSKPASPSSTPVGVGPSAVAIDPSGRFLYVENRSASTLSQFSVNGDGSLTPLNPATIPQDGYQLLADPAGDLLYVGAGSLIIYRIAANGTLQPYSSASTGLGAGGFAVR